MHRRTNGAARVVDRARHFYEDSREVAESGASKAKTFIHNRPILSALLGLGIGFLFGHLTRSSD
jgi:hypothetical protein